MSDSQLQLRISEEGGSYFIIVDKVKYKCSYAESAMLTNLLINKDTFYSKEDLAVIGWPNKLVSKNSVPVAIANIRKILKYHTNLDVIINEKHKGYAVLTDKVKLSSSPMNSIEEALQTDKQAHIKDELNHSPEFNCEVEPLNTTESEIRTKEDKSQTHLIKKLLSAGLGYPLLVLNIAFLITLALDSKSMPDLPSVSVKNASNYLAIYTGDDFDLLSSLLKHENNLDYENMTLTSLEEKLDIAENDKKNIVFINNIGDRIVIDCLAKEELFSYSGNDLDSIVYELKKQGCEL